MFKRIFCLIFFSIFIPHAIHAATTVPGGNVSGTWGITDSPYLIEGDITVPVGATLTIEPGVIVEFQSWYKLTVNGYLQAVGTESQRIVFTAIAPGPGEPGWVGIDVIDAPDFSRLEFCIIENGQAMAADPNDRGGALYIFNSSPTIRHCTIRNNRVSRYGAGIYCENASPTIEHCTITNNLAGYAATSGGGGIYCRNSQPQIIGNIISHNQVSASGGFGPANGLGGAIYLSDSDAVIEYNIIASNTVDAFGNVPTHSRGGAIYLANSDARLVGNTFSDNAAMFAAEGGSLYVSQSNPTAVNNIFWNNAPQEVFFAASGISSILVAYSDVEGGEEAIVTNDSGTVYWQEGNLQSDPLFVDAANDDYALQSGSPAVNSGTAFYEWQGIVLVDLDPDQYVGDAPDMGALESLYTQPANQPPVAVATADPATGEAPLSVLFDSTGSYDPDGTIAGYAWDFDDGSSSTEANPTHTYLDPGTYDATLTVTDNKGATDSDTVEVIVIDAALDEMHVEDQIVTRVRIFRKTWRGIDSVLITDQDNQPVANALVTAEYDGPNSGQASGTTGGDGRVVFITNYVKRPVGIWCFTVTDVSKDGYRYNIEDNVVTTKCE